MPINIEAALDMEETPTASEVSDSDLRKKATLGGGYSALISLSNRLLAILQLAVVARFLGPADFGVYALALVVVTAANTFTALGTERILVQRVDLEPGFVGSAWSVKIVRGLIISGICFVIAPFYGHLVSEPLAERVLYIVALVPFLSGLANPAEFLAQRDLRFGRIAAFQVIMNVLQFVIVVSLVYFLRDVYALAYGYVGVSLVRALFSWIWFSIPHLPRYNRSDFRELLSRGRHFLVISVGAFIMTQADTLIVGRLVGATVLGYYVLAYKISQLAVDVMHKLIGRVAFPVFSQLQHDRERLRRAFDQILQIQMAVLIPLSVFTVAFAPTIVEATLGEKYQQSVLILQLLVLVTIGRGFAHAFSPIIVGTGNEQFASRIKVFETSLFLVAVWLGTSYWGAAGAALGAGLGYLAAGFARSVFVLHLTGFLTTVFLKRVGAPLLASLPGAAFVLVQPIHGLGPILKLIVVTCVFGVVYLLMSLALQKPLIAVVRNNLVSTRS